MSRRHLSSVMCSILVLSQAAISRGDDGIGTLDFLQKRSAVVVAGKILTEPIGESIEAGVVQYVFDFKVTESGRTYEWLDEFKVRATRYELTDRDRPAYLKQGSHCILFLEVADFSAATCVTIDPWFGIQPYNEAMLRALRLLAPGVSAELTADRDEAPRAEPVAAERSREPSYNEAGFTPLHHAAMRGDLSMATRLLSEGADVNVPHQKFRGTPLQYAASGGHPEMARLLMEHGAGVDAVDSHGRTPLMWAAMQGHIEVAGELLKAGADVNRATPSGWTALQYAAQAGQSQLVEFLRERGAQDAPATATVDVASAENPEEPVRNKEMNALDSQGFSTLHRAAIRGDHEAVKDLLARGADTDVAQRQYQGTPLQYAAARGHGQAARLLIEAGANINATDSLGRTPLMWAAMKGQQELVKLLVECGADMGLRSKQNKTAFDYAVEAKADAAARALLIRQ
jgi:ankyrin repeat protein